nr:uncharacterized protein LOC104121443 [Nicotiana tomentosiformis]
MGGLIHDSQGNWIIRFAGNISPTNSVHAELQALFLGLELANHHQLVPLEVNVDASEVLTIIRNDNMHYTNLISDSRQLLDQLHNATITHVYREENGVADRLAKEGCSIEPTMSPTDFASPPVFVGNILQHDQAGGLQYRQVKPMIDAQALHMETTTILFDAHNNGPAST